MTAASAPTAHGNAEAAPTADGKAPARTAGPPRQRNAAAAGPVVKPHTKAKAHTQKTKEKKKHQKIPKEHNKWKTQQAAVAAHIVKRPAAAKAKVQAKAKAAAAEDLPYGVSLNTEWSRNQCLVRVGAHLSKKRSSVM